MLSPAPRVLFPYRERPLAALMRRLAMAGGLLILVATITWVGRGGYQDVDGNPLSALDAIYYASVTMTTTGYGDITPVTPRARAVTTFVVTPLRLLFLIVLVGTTLEILTERFKQSVAESRWRKRVTGHIVVVGYGTKGRAAVESVLMDGKTSPQQVVVIDRQESALVEVRSAGSVGIVGDATRIAALRAARIDEAAALIVTPDRDDTATLITLTARALNPSLPIAAAVREAENAHLLRQSGADTVIVSAEAAGRLLGLSTRQPDAVGVFEDLLVAGEGLDLVERPATADEVAGPPVVRDGKLPIAVVRAGRRIPFDDEAFQRVEPGDMVVCVGT